MTVAPPPGPRRGTEEDERRQTTARQLHERIYATLTMVAVLIGLAEDGPVGYRDAVWACVGTAVGLWLATMVAEQQSFQVVHQHIARGRHLRWMVYATSPLLLSAVGPLVFIGVSALGAMSLHNALLTSVGMDLAELFAWGCVSGARIGGGVLATAGWGLANLVIGAGIVVLKVASVH